MSDAQAALRSDAEELAEDLAASDRVVVSRPAATRTLKDELEAERVEHATLRAGFEDAGWTYDKHLYYREDALAERAAELGDEYRGSGRLLISHSELLADLIDPDVDIDDVAGWRTGGFVETLADAFTGEGWRVDTVGEGATEQRLYLYPLFSALREEHPKGRYPMNQSELLAYYLAESVEEAISEPRR